MDKAVQEGRYHVYVFEGGSRCFAVDTLVVTKDGHKPIQDVQTGEMVKCLDELGNIAYRKVTGLHRYAADKPMVQIMLTNGETIICSADHRFLHEGEYVPIINILKGDKRHELVDFWFYVKNVTEVFDVEVEDLHNYFISVGDLEFNVHNSSKTYSLIQWFIVYALKEQRPTRVVISRKKGTWLNATVWVDFYNILTELGMVEKRDYTRNKTLHQIAINNTTFEFVGLDDVQKLHGLTVDIFWINEAMEASKDDFDQLEQRTSRFAVLDYNPSAEQHWIYDTVCTRNDCYFDHSTMLQNPFIPENSRRKILSYEPTELNFAQGTADERKWKIYGLGMRAALEGLVFNNVEFIDHIPESIDKRAYSVDYGFAQDPSACIEVGYYQNNLYVDEKFYKAGMLTREIIAELTALQRQRRLPIVSESADPRMVEEIRQAGLPIFPVHKYAGSIEAGIDFMRGCKIFVTYRSVNAKKEFENYTYAQDRYGNWLNIPVDDWNHCFTGDTLVSTSTGLIPLSEVSVGDMVLTSVGYKKVCKKFANGCKKVLFLKLYFDKFVIGVKVTPDHKFKTTKGWKQAQHLQPKDKLYLHHSVLEQLKRENILWISTEKDSTCTITSDTIQRTTDGSIESFGNFIMGQSPKGTKSITETTIPSTTNRQTSNVLLRRNTSTDTEKKCEQGGVPKSNFATLKESETSRRLGMQARKDGNGIVNTQRVESPLCTSMCVNAAERNLNPQTKEACDSAQTRARQNGVGTVDSIMKHASVKNAGKSLLQINTHEYDSVLCLALENIIVEKEDNLDTYDIEVDEAHEFFANGILVHNCIDALRYVVLELIIGKNKHPVDIQKAARAIGR